MHSEILSQNNHFHFFFFFFFFFFFRFKCLKKISVGALMIFLNAVLHLY